MCLIEVREGRFRLGHDEILNESSYLKYKTCPCKAGRRVFSPTDSGIRLIVVEKFLIINIS